MKSKQSETQSYLGAFVRVQNRKAKPDGFARPGTSPGPSSNGRSRRGLPSSPDGVSLRPIRGRGCALAPKSALPDPFREAPAPAAVTINRRRSKWVIREVTSGKGFLLSTDEVPRCPGLTRRVTREYKAPPKVRVHASVCGTGSLRPAPQGCQQSQSRCPALAALGTERQNLRKPIPPPPVMRTVSRRIQAPQWPGRTSSGQPPRPLRNIPQHWAGADRVVQPR
jgi:hypothetical protein